MRLQGTFEYLLLIGGVLVVSLVIGGALSSTTQTLSAQISSYNAPDVNYPTYTDKPPIIIDFSVSPENPSTDENITLTCSASDDAELSSIRIYLNGNLAGECSQQDLSAYSCSATLTNLPAGTYTAECVATDASGQSSTSSLSFSVSNNSAPTISITSPSNGATFTAPADVTVSWTASDPDGDTLTFTVNCGNGTTTTTTSTSYTCSYSSAGTYTITVTADDGSATASDSVTISVTSSSTTPPPGGGTPPPGSDTTPPTITSFTANPSTILFNSSTTLTCEATDNVGISSIQIYKNSTDTTPVQTCSSSPCSATVTYITAGTYTPKCVATDTSGNSSSKTTTVTVKNYTYANYIYQGYICPIPFTNIRAEGITLVRASSTGTEPGCKFESYPSYVSYDAIGTTYWIGCPNDTSRQQVKCTYDSATFTYKWNVINTCTDECTAGDTETVIDYCGSCTLPNGLDGAVWQQLECVTGADNDPCTEWVVVSSQCGLCPT